jgi:hypothetical protein
VADRRSLGTNNVTTELGIVLRLSNDLRPAGEPVAPSNSVAVRVDLESSGSVVSSAARAYWLDNQENSVTVGAGKWQDALVGVVECLQYGTSFSLYDNPVDELPIRIGRNRGLFVAKSPRKATSIPFGSPLKIHARVFEVDTGTTLLEYVIDLPTESPCPKSEGYGYNPKIAPPI